MLRVRCCGFPDSKDNDEPLQVVLEYVVVLLVRILGRETSPTGLAEKAQREPHLSNEGV